MLSTSHVQVVGVLWCGTDAGRPEKEAVVVGPAVQRNNVTLRKKLPQ